ncbi:MAG TPA: S46 family peptidase [Gemmatimonadales bacterium]|nr:S46 family peptidase [Gemmatimonadales bacterium]
MHRVRLAFLILVSLCLGAAAALRAQQQAPAEYPGIETGKMWTFDAPPLDYWARRYNFRPSQEWLDHVRLSSGRLPGCSASFVSPDGLVMSNHHCGRGCIDAVTRPGEDLLRDGFYAKTRDEERPCPGMTLDQLTSITDVTDSVSAAIPAGAPAERAATLRDAAIKSIVDRCTGGAADVFCQVVPMYAGGQYKLYKFHRFTDLRLVFAVESQTGFFGGDPDNFTYPRYDLDMSIVRAYVNGQPAHTEYFRWSPNGSSDHELVFAVGNPGGTGRLNTVAQMEYLRDVQYPANLRQLTDRIRIDHQLSNMSEDRARALRNEIFGLENTFKAITGYQAGLTNPQMMEHKRVWERDFRAKVDANPAWNRLYGTAWDESAAVWHQLGQMAVRQRYYAFGAYGARLLQIASYIARLPVESAKPDSARLPMFRDAMQRRVQGMLAAPVDTTSEIMLLTAYFTQMQQDLPAGDPLLRMVLAGRTPEAAARGMVASSQILAAEQRQALIQGGAAAVKASSDPFIKLALFIDPTERQLAKQANDLNARDAQAGERIARALLAVFGNTVSPDATFSLRIQDGEVMGYPYNGTIAPPFTTFYGLYDRYYSFGEKPPFDLAQRWITHRDSLNLSTPLDAVSTCDIIGGNSGSPVINKNAEIVGLVFDGNIEDQPLRFLYSEAVGRAVWVDSRGIIEALRHVYDAGPLADEMTGRH